MMSLHNSISIGKKKLLPEEPNYTSLQALEDLDSLWRPYLFWMKFFGLYHFRRDHDNGPIKRWANPLKVYCGLVVIMCSLQFIWRLRSIGSDLDDKKKMLFFICLYIFMIIIQVFTVTFFHASHASTKLFHLYQVWADLRFCPECAALVERKIRFRTRLVTYVTAFVLCMCYIVHSRNMYFAGSFEYNQLVFFPLESIECFSIGFVVLVCSSISVVINTFNSQLEAFIKSPLDPVQWEHLRSTFGHLTELVNAVDDVFYVCLGVTMVGYLIELVMLSSNVLLTKDFITSFASIWWTSFIYFSTAMLFWVTSSINATIHSSYDQLSRMRIGDLPIRLQNELLFFQNRLGTPTIGISLFKMYLVNRGTLSSIASLYLTYLLVSLQFNGCG